MASLSHLLFWGALAAFVVTQGLLIVGTVRSHPQGEEAKRQQHPVMVWDLLWMGVPALLLLLLALLSWQALRR